MRMKISQLRNLLPVACLFQSSTLLNSPNEPMHELTSSVPARSRVMGFNAFLYMVCYGLFDYRLQI